MNERTKKWIVTGIISIFFIFIVGYLFFCDSVTKNRMENELEKHQKDFMAVIEYIERHNYDSVYVTLTYEDGILYVDEIGDVEITDETVKIAINRLFDESGYSVISKDKNGIYFQRWSNLKIGKGVVYSLDGNKPINEYLIKLEDLKKCNWYYYEEE